jgi:release factor glutamine methyltransferase
MSEPWTVGRLLTWTTEFLQKHGSSTPRLDAEVLLADARACQRIGLYTAFDQVVDETVKAKFRELVQRRAAGEPVAYLVGRKEFYSLLLRVTPDVLIPRPETEHLVIAVLDLLKSALPRETPPRIADIGVGSGAIAIAVAKHAPQAEVTAVDISPAALAIAQENAAAHGVANRIQFLQSDLFAALPPDAAFDIIVSNPPYVKAAELPTLLPEVRDHEPHVALVSGPTGLGVTTRLIGEAASRLRPGGWLVLEIHSGLESQVRALLEHNGNFGTATTIKDLAQFPRVVKAQRI